MQSTATIAQCANLFPSPLRGGVRGGGTIGHAVSTPPGSARTARLATLPVKGRVMAPRKVTC
jgi:hypothetical protein